MYYRKLYSIGPTSYQNNDVISSDLESPLTRILRSQYFPKANIIQTGALHVVRLTADNLFT